MIAGNGETHRSGGTKDLGKDAAIQNIDCRWITKLPNRNAVIECQVLIHKISFGPQVNKSHTGKGGTTTAQEGSEGGTSLVRWGKGTRARQYSPVYWRALSFTGHLVAKCSFARWFGKTTWLRNSRLGGTQIM